MHIRMFGRAVPAMLFIGLLAAAAVAAAQSGPANLLVNGSIDGGIEGWETWTPQGQPQISYDTTVYRSAPGSAKLQGFSAQDRAALVQRPEVIPGKTYKISAWVKTENVSRAGVMLRVQFNLATNPSQKTRDHIILGNLQGTNDWTLLEETFVVPPGTGTLIVEPFLDRAQGIVWWDDITLTLLD